MFGPAIVIVAVLSSNASVMYMNRAVPMVGREDILGIIRRPVG